MRSMNGISVIMSVLLFIVSQSSLAKNLSDVRWTAEPGTVSLTFDDGPSPIFTPQILDILKENNVKATFFVMGPLAKKYPELIGRMVAEGHAVGVHTMTHPKLPRLNDAQLYYEVVGSSEMVQKILKTQPVCLRPPFGLKSKHVEKYVASQHLILVPRGFNSFDYKNRGVEPLANWVIKNAHAGQVFLLHDGFTKREETVAALPKIIAGIRQKGLGFSAICYP